MIAWPKLTKPLFDFRADILQVLASGWWASILAYRAVPKGIGIIGTAASALGSENDWQG